MNLLLLRPYYGININSDMHGDLGVSDYLSHVFPDIYMVQAASLASLRSDVDITVIDANAEKLFPKQVMEMISNTYDYIIIKIAAPTAKFDLMFAEALKEKFTRSRVILAGQTAKVLATWVKDNLKNVEVAEVPLDDYLYKLLFNKKESLPLDLYPSPDYRYLPYQCYVDPDRELNKRELRGSLIASRGCAMGCDYCPYTMYYERKVDFRSVEKVIADIQCLLDLNISIIQFRDQFFTANHTYVKELCHAILKKNLKFSWKCETRLESLTPELIDLMAEAGLKMIFFGVESASDTILNSYHRHKSIPVEQMKLLIDYLNKKGVATGGFYIIGFPQDTWKSINDTLNLSVFLNTSFAKFSLFTSYPTQQIWEDRFPHVPVTPELFPEFENILSVNQSHNLTTDELRFAENMVTMMFYNTVRGLDYTHRTFYKPQQESHAMITRLKEAIAVQPIAEFGGTEPDFFSENIDSTIQNPFSVECGI